MRMMSLDQLKDRDMGKIGTPERDKYESDLKPKTEARKGWKKAFKEMHDRQEDQLLMNDVFEDEALSYESPPFNPKSIMSITKAKITKRKGSNRTESQMFYESLPLSNTLISTY